MHHFVSEMCTCVHISVTKWCIVGYLSDALWDLWDGCVGRFKFKFGRKLQPSVLQHWEILDNTNTFLFKKKKKKKLKLICQWLIFRGGFRVKPSMLEFWQGQTTRLHDRFRFRRPAEGETIDSKVTHQGADGWVFERLAPWGNEKW